MEEEEIAAMTNAIPPESRSRAANDIMYLLSTIVALRKRATELEAKQKTETEERLLARLLEGELQIQPDETIVSGQWEWRKCFWCDEPTGLHMDGCLVEKLDIERSKLLDGESAGKKGEG